MHFNLLKVPSMIIMGMVRTIVIAIVLEDVMEDHIVILEFAVVIVDITPNLGHAGTIQLILKKGKFESRLIKRILGNIYTPNILRQI